jgi:Zn-dependent protease
MDNLAPWPLAWSRLLFLPGLFVGFTVHELAHAIVAFSMGDTSQVERNRLSFNPLRHVSWLGLAVFMLMGFGWAKTVAVDPTRFRVKNAAFGMFLVAIAGAAPTCAWPVV